MEIINLILIGVASAVVFAFFGILIKNVLIPWISSITYHGVDISGDWYTKATLPSGNLQDMIMKIEQRGKNIKGRICITKHIKKTGTIEIKNFLARGEIKDRFLYFNAKNIDKRTIGIHLELLEVIGDAKLMKGYGTWYSITNKHIQSKKYTWTQGNPKH